MHYLCSRTEPNLKAIQLLIENGANINEGETTPLGALCYSKTINHEAVHLLVKNGADLNKGIETPLGILVGHRKYSEISLMKYLLDNGADVNKGFNKNIDNTLLHFLCIGRIVNFDIIKLFIEKGANVNESRIPIGKSTRKIEYLEQYTLLGDILQQRVIGINIELIRLLLESGADPNKEFKINENIGFPHKNTFTPLGYLCYKNNVNFDLYKLLIDYGADINKGDCGFSPFNDSYTPLGLVCKNEPINIELIKFLLENGADVNKTSRERSQLFTPLQFLYQHKNVNEEAIKLLQEKM